MPQSGHTVYDGGGYASFGILLSYQVQLHFQGQWFVSRYSRNFQNKNQK